MCKDNVTHVRIGLKYQLVLWLVVIFIFSCNNLFAVETLSGSISLGGTVSGYIDDSEDWYQLNLNEESPLEFIMDASGDLTPTFSIYNEDGTTYIAGASSIEQGGEARERVSLSAGTYYVKASNYYVNDDGNYTLSVNREKCVYGNDAEPNNSAGDALTTVFGGTYDGYVNSTNGIVRDNKDWYKLVLSEECTVKVVMDASEGLTPTFSIYNEDTTTYITGDSDIAAAGEASVEKSLSAGTYYIVASNYYSGDYGSYKLTIDRLANEYNNDLEPNNGVAEAIVVMFDHTYEGYMNSTNGIVRDDEDWYKLVLDEECTVKVVMDASEKLTPTFSIYNLNDEDERVYITGDSDISHAGEAAEVTSLSAGTYYIVASNYYSGDYGSYSLTVERIATVYDNDIEPNNGTVEAISIVPGNVYEGYVNSTNGIVRDDEDWYKLVLDQEGAIQVTMDASEGLTPTVSIYNGDGTTYITSKSSITAAGKASFEASLRAGTYYIVASNYYSGDYGSYSLTIESVVKAYANDIEPNNSIGEAITVSRGNVYTGYVNSYDGIVRDDEDWYKISLNYETTIQIQLDGSEGLTPSFSVYRSDGTSYVTGGGSIVEGGEVTKKITFSKGTYYIRVDPYYSGDYGSYQLTLATDYTDVLKAKSHYGDRSGDASYDADADVNADGIIDIIDIVNRMKDL